MTKDQKKKKVSQLLELRFAEEARRQLEIDESSYYWDEYISGLDHMDVSSIADLCEAFFFAGKDAAVEVIKKEMKDGL